MRDPDVSSSNGSGRSRCLPAAALVVSLALAGCSGASGPGSPDPQRARAIVLVTVDGLVPAKLSVFGGPEAVPRLEELARAGHGWPDALSACPLTRPAVATYLTGLAPDVHGVRDDTLTSLAPDVPTLATALGQAGFVTAAFPDSSFLGSSSGLLRGFELVDDPPVAVAATQGWLPLIRRPHALVTDFRAWVEPLPQGTRYFAWLHFSQPLVEQMVGPLEDEGSAEAGGKGAVAQFDHALGLILSSLAVRGDLEQAAVIVAGTMAVADEGDDVAAGPGASLDARATTVALIARFPAGVEPKQPFEPTPWSPDVAVSLARLGGVELPGAEGRDLLAGGSAERTVFSWSWVPRDQMGWRPLAMARRGSREFVDGDGTSPGADAESAALAQALGSRARPPAPAVPLESVRALIATHKIELTPVPEEGRPFGPASRRVEVTRRVWEGRLGLARGRVQEAAAAFGKALALDPDNLAALVGMGLIDPALSDARARGPIERAVALYPSNPEVLHAYAHALWPGSWAEAERLILAILPFKLHEGDLLYDLACSRSLGGDLPASEKYLRKAIDAGYHYWEHIDSDPDLRNLRESQRLAQVLRDYRR